jgi:hypothetical protein
MQASSTPLCLTSSLALTLCATEILYLKEQVQTLHILLNLGNHSVTVSRFAEAMYSGAAIMNDRIVQLPNDVYWVDDPKRGGSLFARDCYEKLWDCVSDENQRIRCFSICGNPGIEKSWFLFYVMYRLAQEGKSMVYAYTMDTVNQIMLVQPPNVVLRSEFYPSPEIKEVLKDCSAWYLVDGPVDVGRLLFLPVNARVLQVTSPDRKNFKHFLKMPAHQYFMPAWTHDELEDYRQKLYPSVSADNLTELERIAGPVPCFVLEDPSVPLRFTNDRKELDSTPSRFMKARKKLEERTRAAVNCMSLDNILYALEAAEANDSYRALQIEVNPITFTSVGLRLASPFVEEQFLTRITEISLNCLCRTYQNASGSIKGTLYEACAHRILSGRGQTPLFMRSLKDGRTTEDRIGERTLLLEQTYEQKMKINTTTYGVPASRTFPAIDAVCLPYFFQMTIQPSHSIILKPFATFVHHMIASGSMKQEEKIKLVFVVPPAVLDNYTMCVPWSDN